MNQNKRFFLRPRFVFLAGTTIVIGFLFFIAGIVLEEQTLMIIIGLVGIILSSLYLFSSAWKLYIHVDKTAIEVIDHKNKVHVTLPWNEIEKVIASPSTHTCYIDSGDTRSSILIPGVGATASYSIKYHKELFHLILNHVPDNRVLYVDLLEEYL